jgi:hypothetical protein
MITSEAEAKERYKAIEREADSLGRIIGVRRLRPSEQAKIAGYTPDLSGSEKQKVVNDDGTTIEFDFPHRGPFQIAASVCEIRVDGELARIPFPRNRAELDSIYDRLDIQGLQAAVTAMTRLNADEAGKDVVAEAKNS